MYDSIWWYNDTRKCLINKSTPHTCIIGPIFFPNKWKHATHVCRGVCVTCLNESCYPIWMRHVRYMNAPRIRILRQRHRHTHTHTHALTYTHTHTHTHTNTHTHTWMSAMSWSHTHTHTHTWISAMSWLCMGHVAFWYMNSLHGKHTKKVCFSENFHLQTKNIRKSFEDNTRFTPGIGSLVSSD